nr:MAG TPA: hypothetical protein [Caudoviricetes sp.]
MQTIHLTNIHLGGATPGATAPTPPPPTPALPDAGRPYVEGVTYDPDTKRVRLQARVAQAGEVKDPVGEVQEFPIHVPTPPQLPDAGRPYVDGFTFNAATKKARMRAMNTQAGEVKEPLGDWQEFQVELPPAPQLPDAGKAYADSCTYDHATRTVTVHARNPQAGEVKSPDGETRQFPIEVPEEPQVTGVVYEYIVDNMTAMPQNVSADTGTPPPGEQMGAAEATLSPADPTPGPTVFVYSYVKPFPEGIQLSLRPLSVSPGKASYMGDASLFVLGSNLVISRQVSIVDN